MTPELITVPESWFWMGSDDQRPLEGPRHRVWVDTFQIARTAVTRRHYAEFLAQTGHVPPRGWNEEAFSLLDQPVVGVNWFDAQRYCDWISREEGRRFRLPTEAEWERACRGSEEGGPYPWGDQQPSEISYFGGDWTGPRPVAEWRPNSLGLWNMGDNVHEWCEDWYSAGYYAVSVGRNPPGPRSGTRRASRGGSWRHKVRASRITQRSSLPPTFRYTDYGFRLAR